MKNQESHYYAAYSLVIFLICIFLIFYTEMTQDKTYGSINKDTTQFSGNMAVFLILYIIILA